MSGSPAQMNSCLYACRVMHARLHPRRHRFAYRLFVFALDLDELDALSRRTRLFSHRARSLFTFREADYLPVHEERHAAEPELGAPGNAGLPPGSGVAPSASLKTRVIAYAASHGVDLNGGRVVLVTLPRMFGYAFNPVSFYFCYDRTGRPAAAIAEVTNTFREMKPYFLGRDRLTIQGDTFRLRVPKHFYVSPFSALDVAFDFTLRLPGTRLAVQIDDFDGETRTLTSTFTGVRREISSGLLAWYLVRYPALTLRVIFLIHWHAWRLWRKRVPWHAKADRPADQRDLYRPHASLRPPPPSTSRPASLPHSHPA